ncbi:hypothetical protein BJV78DRAFT_219366 [Lactifluus subvellereus]|nr:hypothetical protein BJV78DRAFT_219366 [Lactifluus subvellereus]
MCQNADVRYTLGAVLGGALLSTTLSGFLCLQTFLYVQHCQDDSKHLKALVALVWTLDTIHTSCIATVCYQYLILNFGRPEIVDHIFRHVPGMFGLFNDPDAASDYIVLFRLLWC